MRYDTQLVVIPSAEIRQCDREMTAEIQQISGPALDVKHPVMTPGKIWCRV